MKKWAAKMAAGYRHAHSTSIAILLHMNELPVDQLFIQKQLHLVLLLELMIVVYILTLQPIKS